MELESEDGWKILIKEESKIELGRGIGILMEDRTVSRRHILLQFRPSAPSKYPKPNDPIGENPVSFEVIGKNPILLFGRRGKEKRVFRNSEKGEIGFGDRLSFSLKKPVFFTLKKKDAEGEAEDEEERVSEAVERRKKRTLERKEKEEKMVCLKEEDLHDRNGDEEEGVEDLGFGSLDISQIDPAKEFGFLVLGQEFNHYSKQKISNIKDWDWFLEEPSENSEDDEAVDEERSKVRKRGMRKKKKGQGDNDEEWAGESEDEKALIENLRSAKRPKYSTRLKDKQKPHKDMVGSKKSVLQKNNYANKDDRDEDDESLGGFIVDDDGLEEEEEHDDEEEEFEDDDDEDDEEMVEE